MNNEGIPEFSDDMDPTQEEIGDCMTSPVLSIDHKATVQEAAQFMQSRNIGCLLVKEFDDYVGIVTETDLSRKVVGKGLNPDATEVSSIMTKPIHSMDRFLPVDEANKYMHKKKIRHLGVTEDDKIVGIISMKDLVAYYAKSSFRMQE